MTVDLVAPAAFAARIAALDATTSWCSTTSAARPRRAALERAGPLGGARRSARASPAAPHLFGDPAWADSPLAPLLPVELLSQAPEPKEREPIALELVIDRSNSMGFSSRPGPERRGREDGVRARAPRSPCSISSARTTSSERSPSTRSPTSWAAGAGGREPRGARAQHPRRSATAAAPTSRRRSRSRAASSSQANRPVRHVILLTDGDTNRRSDDHQDLIADLARDEITVTAIRIGHDTGNLELLERIARETGGEFHHVDDAERAAAAA